MNARPPAFELLRPTAMVLLLLSLPHVAFAQVADSREAIPPALAPWVPWVLAGDERYGCTMPSAAAEGDRGGEAICVWPGELELAVEPTGGTFVLTGSSDRRFPFELPGESRSQPVDVRLNGRPAVVLSEAGRSYVWVDAGDHRIEGRFAWSAPPETLTVPQNVARVHLVQDGETIVATRGTNGEVWLRARETESLGEDRVSLEVHRRLEDGSPMSLTTRILVRAAGRARELALGRILPDGTVPVEVTADLPVRMLPNGELTVQLHAGEFTVTVLALIADPEASYARPALGEPWPAQEVWVWAPNENFRQVELAGVDGIDPARTSLPEDWRSYSAYLLGEDDTLTLTTSRRGEPTPPPNELTLTRTVWLDTAGTGYTVQDDLNVTMHSVHRMELLEGDLGRVSFAGADQLITTGEGGHAGVELRATSASLTAEWRFDGAPGTLPAVGWSEDAQSSSTTLNLPPGWELIHASGVDRAPSTWVSRWTLLGFFALLLITAAVGRVYGWRWGIVAFVGVGLGFHLDEAPRWIWLLLAALLALHRALGARRFARWVRFGYVAVALLAIVLSVVFAAGEARNALYPQLAPPASVGMDSTMGWGSEGNIDLAEGTFSRSLEVPSAMRAEEAVFDDEGGRGLRRESVGRSGSFGGFAGYGSNSVWLDPSAVVQTGFGMPSWGWSSYALAFDGPVARDHRIGLVLSPPWLTSLVALMRAVLTLALLAAALLLRPKTEGAKEGSTPPAPLGTAAVLSLLTLFGATGLFGAGVARAQDLPPPELLTELHERLTRAPTCERCADANRLAVSVVGDVLTVELEVSAAANAAYPLPGPSATWAPDTVLLDGRPTNAVVRLPSGFLHARVPEGVHTLRLSGPLAGRDAITLAFGRAPRTVSVTAEGWEVDGLSGESVAESIQLRRMLSAEVEEGSELRSELPTWLEIERRLDIGVRWTITSVVRRRSPANAPAVARIPLLPGESVTDSSVTVENGLALITLGQSDTEVSWTSTLEPAETVTLTAPEEGRLSELWVLACSALWHCETSGIAPTVSGSGTSWEPAFHPWPGEALTLAITRPPAADGQSVTLDRAVLTVRPGVRLTSATLELSVRSSISTPLRIDVPSGSDIRSVTLDGGTRPLSREGDTVVVALQPGSHSVTLEWQEARGWEISYRTPEVRVGNALVNAELIIEGSTDRWVLWLTGPSWGPAVLFWPYLALVLVLALALSRQKKLPLRPHDWALLLVGLTQIEPFGAIVVVGWFFVLSTRKESKVESALLFDVRQLFVVGYTLLTFSLLVWAVEAGLLGDPEMGIAGPSCWDNHFRFFVDRSDGALPTSTVLSLPIWVFRVLMFAWALWLVVALLRWARWGWTAFKEDGLFRPLGGHPPAPGAPSDGAVSDADAGSAAEPPSPASPASPATETPEAPAGEPAEGGASTALPPNDDDE